MLRDESKIDGKRRVIVDDAADSMHAVDIQLLRLVTIGIVLREELRYIVMIDLIELSFRRERHKNYLWKNYLPSVNHKRFLVKFSSSYLSILRHQLNVPTFLLFTANAIQIVFLRRCVALAVLSTVLEHSQQAENFAGFRSDFYVMRLAWDVICLGIEKRLKETACDMNRKCKLPLGLDSVYACMLSIDKNL